MQVVVHRPPDMHGGPIGRYDKAEAGKQRVDKSHRYRSADRIGRRDLHLRYCGVDPGFHRLGEELGYCSRRPLVDGRRVEYGVDREQNC